MPDQEIDNLLAEYTKLRVDEEADRQGVPKDFARRLVGTESSFNPEVIAGRRRSSAGAIGATQVMPGTAKQLKIDPYHVEQNIEGGLRYAKTQLDDFGGDQRKAAAAYNWGPGRVRKYGTGRAPAETQNYMNQVAGKQKPADDIDSLYEQFQQESNSTPGAPSSKPRLVTKTSTSPAQKTAPPPRPDLSSLAVVGHDNKPSLTGLDLVRSGFQAQRGQSPLQRQARQQVRQAKIDKARQEYEARSPLGKAGQIAVEGLTPGFDALANIGNKIYGGLGAIGGGEYEEPIPRLSEAAKEDLAIRAEANNSLPAQVGRGIAQAIPSLPLYVGAGMLGGPAGVGAVAGLNALQEDFKDPFQSAANVVLNTAVPLGAGKVVGAAARPLLRNLPTPALRLAGNIASEGVGGAAGNVATALAEGVTDPQQLVAQGLIGAATAAPFGAKLRPEQVGPTPRQQARAVANEPLPAPQMIRPETRQSRGYLPTEVTKLQGPETRRVIPRVMDQIAYDAEMERLKSPEGTPRERQAAIENLTAQDLFKTDQKEFFGMAPEEQAAMLKSLPPDLARALQQRPVRLGGPNIQQAGEGRLEPPLRPRSPAITTPELSQPGRQAISPEAEPQLAPGMYGNRPNPKSRQQLEREAAQANIAPQKVETPVVERQARMLPKGEPTSVEPYQQAIEGVEVSRPGMREPSRPRQNVERPQLLPAGGPIERRAPQDVERINGNEPIRQPASTSEQSQRLLPAAPLEPLVKKSAQSFNKPEPIKEPFNQDVAARKRPSQDRPGTPQGSAAERAPDIEYQKRLIESATPENIDRYVRTLERQLPGRDDGSPEWQAKRDLLDRANERRAEMRKAGQVERKYEPTEQPIDYIPKAQRADDIVQPIEEQKRRLEVRRQEKAARLAEQKGTVTGEKTSLETPRAPQAQGAGTEPVRPQAAATPEGQGRTAQEGARTEVEPYATHQDFGPVTLAENQAGARKGKVKVVDAEGQPHEINKVSRNQRAIRTKSEPTKEPAQGRLTGQERQALGKMYHGTSANTPFDVPKGRSWFTSDPNFASDYAAGAHVGGPEGPQRIYPARVEIKKPYRVKDRLEQVELVNDPDRLNELERQGYDGVIRTDADGKVIALPFKDQQIKSKYEAPASRQRRRAASTSSAPLPGSPMATKKAITDIPRDEYIKQQIEKTGLGGLSQKAAEAEYGAIYDQAAKKAGKTAAPIPKPSPTKPAPPERTAAAPKPASREQGSSGGNERSILDAMVKVKPESLQGGLTSIRDMRKASGLSPGQFDAAIKKMVDTDELTLHRHDHPSSLTDAERAEMIRLESPRGDYTDPKTGKKYDYYVGAALRNDAGSVEEALQRFVPKQGLSFGKLPGESKGGTILGAGFGSLQSGLRGRQKAPAAPARRATFGQGAEQGPRQQQERVSDTGGTGAAVGRAVKAGGDILRTVRTSFDLSAPFTQGAMLTLSHPGHAAKSMAKMFQSLGEPGAERIQKEIVNSPSYKLGQKFGLFTATEGHVKQGAAKEEAYSSDWLNKQWGIRHSERTYRNYLDTLRLSVWDGYVNRLKADGITPEKNPKAYEDAAKAINIFSGRGALKEGGLIDKASPLMSALLFSPRNLVSNFQAIDPVRYAKMDPAARKLAVADAMKAYGAMAGAAVLLKAAGAQVGLNPTDDDFLQVRSGDTRVDLSMGKRTQVQFLAKMLKGTANRVSGKQNEYGKDPVSVASKFASGKMSPALGTARSLLTGKDFKGEKIWDENKSTGANLAKVGLDNIAPMLAADLIEAAQKEGAIGAAKMIPSILGARVAIYPDRPKTSGNSSSGRPRRERRGRSRD